MSKMSWKKTAVPCLYLEENSGRYYGRIYTDGEATWQSLHTDSFGVAKRRLPDKQKELRLMSERRAHHDGINGVTVPGFTCEAKGTHAPKCGTSPPAIDEDEIRRSFRILATSVRFLVASNRLATNSTPPIPRPQRLLLALPLRPVRSTLRTNSLKSTSHLQYFSFRLLAKWASTRFRNASPVFVFPILIAGWSKS